MTTNQKCQMHKSYQSALPTSNKLLQKKWDETYYNEHRRLVRKAKPMVDTAAPKQHPHVISKQKKEQLLKERGEVVDRDNLTLMKKMESITQRRPGGPGLDHVNQYHGKHHSLNYEQRQSAFQRISKENEATSRRIQQVQPHYKNSQWVDDWRHSQKFTQLITTYPQQSPLKNSSLVSTKSDKTTASFATDVDSKTDEQKLIDDKSEGSSEDTPAGKEDSLQLQNKNSEE